MRTSTAEAAAAALACLLVLAPPVRAADPVPLGPPFQVSTDPGGFDPQIASDPSGNFMIVWKNGGEVRGRRYYATGQAAGGEFVASAPDHFAFSSGDTDSVQTVAADPGGNFMVAYGALAPVGGCDHDTCIFSRRFSVDFDVGPPFVVQDPNGIYPDQQAINPEIAADGEGKFIVAWEGYDYMLGEAPPEYYGSGEGTWARRLVSSGQTTGGAFLANTRSDGYQGDSGYLDVAADGEGRFAVVWKSEDYDSGDDGTITLQRFTKTGGQIGGELHVSSDADYGFDPHVAAAPSGEMMVVWQRSGIQGRVVDPVAGPIGVDLVMGVGQYSPDVAAADSSFTVVWGTDSVTGKTFDLTGAPLTGEFPVPGASDAEEPAVAADASGNLVVTWTDGTHIMAQRLQAVAPTPDEIPVFGKTLVLRNVVPENKEKNAGKWKASGPEIVAPPRGTLGDPRCNADPPGTVKAGVRFASASSGQDTGLIPLPCQNWFATGSQNAKAVARRGYRYADPRLEAGPCNAVRIVGTKSISVSCRGKGDATDFLYDLMPGTSEGTVVVVLEMGDVRHCSAFPPAGDADGSDGKKLKGKNAPPPLSCPAALLPTPTPAP